MSKLRFTVESLAVKPCLNRIHRVTVPKTGGRHIIGSRAVTVCRGTRWFERDIGIWIRGGRIRLRELLGEPCANANSPDTCVERIRWSKSRLLQKSHPVARPFVTNIILCWIALNQTIESRRDHSCVELSNSGFGLKFPTHFTVPEPQLITDQSAPAHLDKEVARR